MAFAGTTQKCRACSLTVYLVDRLAADNRIYHKACFRCHHCNGTLKLGNFNSIDGVLYCRPHYDQIFKRTGSHKSCFKCTHGGCTISPSNYIAHEGKLYCKHHHIQLFKAKGNYSQLETELEKDPSLPTPLEVAANL